MLKLKSIPVLFTLVLSIQNTACTGDDAPVEEALSPSSEETPATLDEAPLNEGVSEDGIGQSEGDLGQEGIDQSQSQSFDLAGATVYFEYDDSSVTASSASTLESLASYLNQNQQVKITIEGHCDERGSTEYNLALGQRRAQAVKKYLLDLGVAESQLSTMSYGEERLKATGLLESDHSQNRRAEFTE